jgi:hypothetical protein
MLTSARSYASLPELRDALLRIDPLNVEHVKKVNAAEAESTSRLRPHTLAA